MSNVIELENIDEMRRKEGIDDVELRQEIHDLGVGEFVRLTLVTGPTTFESLLVRITSIQGDNFRGKLAGSSASAGHAKLQDGTRIVFTTAHIHSLPKAPPPAHHQ